MSNKVLVLGYFGYRSNQLDGQTIKTRNVYEMLKLAPYCNDPKFFDTESFKESKLNVFKMFWEVWNTDKLIYIPAHNNLKFFFPIIYILSRIKKVSIAYVVVGGWLADFIKNKPLHRAWLAKIDMILPQTSDLSIRLRKEYRFDNVVPFPNFRITDFRPSIGEVNNGELKLVFMARVRKMKGVDVIFKTLERMNEKYGHALKLSLDFYGPIFQEEKEYFEHMLAAYPEASYQGELSPSSIYDVLSRYDALLLPTKYYTEGFPGSILDAYLSGIPVVVSDWQYSKEFVEHEVSGLISRWDDEKDFTNQVDRLYQDRELLYDMKSGAMEHGRKYSMQTGMNILEPFIKKPS